MIAAHSWDLMGARAVGCEVAFLERKDVGWFPLTPSPSLMAANLQELASKILDEARTHE